MRQITKFGRKDNCAADIRIERKSKGAKSNTSLFPTQTNWLFPFDCRKLSDIPKETFKYISMNLTVALPAEDQVWYYLISNMDNLDTDVCVDLQKTILNCTPSPKNPYPIILQKYKECEGTFGGLLNALEKFKAAVKEQSQKDDITEYLKNIEDIRQNSYENILHKLEKPSMCIKIEDFKRMLKKLCVRVKTNLRKTFSEVKGVLEMGDQLWMLRQSTMLHKSYAHVAIITEVATEASEELEAAATEDTVNTEATEAILTTDTTETEATTAEAIARGSTAGATSAEIAEATGETVGATATEVIELNTQDSETTETTTTKSQTTVKFIEVNPPNYRGKSIIKEGNENDLKDIAVYFVVKPEDSTVDRSVYRKRAKACLDIQFDYDAENANCETFCHRIHGDWKKNTNVQTATGAGQNIANTVLKMINLGLNKDAPLDDQIKNRILYHEEDLMLPLEKKLFDGKFVRKGFFSRLMN